jgi:hypothetical protein
MGIDAKGGEELQNYNAKASESVHKVGAGNIPRYQQSRSQEARPELIFLFSVRWMRRIGTRLSRRCRDVDQLVHARVRSATRTELLRAVPPKKAKPTALDA